MAWSHCNLQIVTDIRVFVRKMIVTKDLKRKHKRSEKIQVKCVRTECVVFSAGFTHISSAKRMNEQKSAALNDLFIFLFK